MDPSQPGGQQPPDQPQQQGGPQPHPAPAAPPPYPGPQPHPAAPHPAAPHQHPHPAYQPHHQFPGYPVPPPPPPAPSVNGLAIASLVTGIVCCLPPLGLVFGTIAIRQIRKKGQRGLGMAFTGTILSAVSTVLVVIMFATGAAGSLWDGFEKGMDEASRNRSAMDLRKGDCLDLPGGGGLEDAEVLTVQTVDCAERHDAEITGIFQITGFKEYPGESRVEALAEERCEKINRKYALDPWDIPAEAELYYYVPLRESWTFGDREVVCTLAVSDKDGLTGSLRTDVAALDRHQTAYLTAESQADSASNDVPVEEYSDDRAAYRAWAREASAVFAAQARALRDHDWPTKAEKTMAKRAKEFDAVALDWDKAADAKGEDAFWTHVAAADGPLENDGTEVEVRKALGLRSTPPPEGDSQV
ncbi:DUF4190 domain-containing protein [Streptomyces jumonjinensis]|uniref:DUF4190 domain-containing protein n=1 Tax=Streptomyces jumonjinensis TaxID=1945 RepID=UPI00379298BC